MIRETAIEVAGKLALRARRRCESTVASLASRHPLNSLAGVFVKKRNYGVTLSFGKVRAFPVREALGARYDFSKFVADGTRMRDVVAGQYENRHAKSSDKVSIYGKDEVCRPPHVLP